MFKYLPLLSPLAAIAHQQDIPANVQVDVVFPRDGGKYAPVYPFPIVLAIHNLSQVWNYDFQLYYSISRVESAQDGDFAFSDVVWPVKKEDGLKTGPNTKVGPPSDKFFFINGTEQFARINSGEFEMYVRLRMNVNCTKGTVTAEERDEALRYTPGTGSFGSVKFTLGNDGELPDMMASGECADPLVAMEVNDTVLYDDALVKEDWAGWDGKQCPILTDPYPEPKGGCQYRLTPDNQKQVEEEMLKLAGCAGRDGASWPSKDLVGSCDENSGWSKGSRVVLSMVGVMSFVTMILVW